MTVFISDIHLGNKYITNIKPLLEWLGKIPCDEEIYLVGDIIDDHRLPVWPTEHTLLLDLIINGFEKVTWVYGNHDRWFAEIATNFRLKHITVNERTTYSTNGKDYLVIHGHQFDHWLKLSFGLSSSHVGHSIRRIASGFHSKFANSVIQVINYAQGLNFDGVICGHFHYPLNDVYNGDFQYINCGDWFENFTVVRELNGEFELIYLQPQPELVFQSSMSEDDIATIFSQLH